MRRLLILVALVGGIWLGWTMHAFIAKDSCLDAGGKWDGWRGVCLGVN
ncbi:hypothetical protein [Oceanomicrobium pacificus]|uniref:Uncharacterized protein n=1 Tax=Oceanomicrobium pacificus TaxID=2692916 RepID=A0A6B0U7I8_9RHOB|nr:hypothetical protein [Oceanomicrobium pacificus]MXU66831.1 hypothetical protein [Oceanomicrobium pacificus]